MKKHQIILVALALIAVFLLVFSPHFNYPFPYHVDEWHHLSQAKRIINGEYERGIGTLEAGFQFFLAGLWVLPSLSQGGDQGEVLNLVLIYKFLPALWAVLAALALFWTTRRLTGNFLIALLSIIFFASLKSNVNLTGLWFFTPLAFAIPFIFLYFYFLTEGINQQKKKLILIGLMIMIFLLPAHAVSVLFALPFLTIYFLINCRFLIKEWKFFTLFLIIPLVGILFYKFSFNLPWQELGAKLLEQIQFKRGWGVLELNNPLTEIYGGIGFILAIIGAVSIIIEKKTKKYLVYLLWPVVMLFWIIIYRITGVSFFSPHQRNLYYLALGLPLLSAIGLFYLISLFRVIPRKIPRFSAANLPQKYITFLIIALIITPIVFLTFQNYYQTPYELSLYRVIDERDYQDLKYLAGLAKGKVVAEPMISTAMYALSNHEPVADLTFKEDELRAIAEKFFSQYDCDDKKYVIDYFKAGYVVSPQKIDCGWKLIYQGKNIIYQIDAK